MASGTFSPPARVIAFLAGHSAAAVTDELYLLETQMPCDGRVGGVQVGAATAGSGTGNTVVDVLVDGVSIYGATADRPALAAASTGDFTSGRPAKRALRVGDTVQVQVKEIPSGAGHARLRWCLAIERP